MIRPAILLVALAGLSACAPTIRAGTVPYDSAGQISSVLYGTILSVTPVAIDGRTDGAGGAIGSVAGGVIGAQIGGGSAERAVASVAGILIGGVVGQAIERDATATTGFAYTIRLDDGRTVQIVEPGKAALAEGSRVQVVWGQGVARLQASAAR
jgi:outer membrane lipoprotein SlyB